MKQQLKQKLKVGDKVQVNRECNCRCHAEGFRQCSDCYCKGETFNNIGSTYSSLYNRVYEICNSVYAPEASTNGNVADMATRDVLKIIAEEVENTANRFDNFKVTEPPSLSGVDKRKSWIAGQMNILLQIKELKDIITT